MLGTIVGIVVSGGVKVTIRTVRKKVLGLNQFHQSHVNNDRYYKNAVRIND